MSSPVYLDHAATTPVDPRVLEAMLPYFTERFGNAASRQHARGAEAADAVEKAREQVARALSADPREIVFTSGATESDNLALAGVIASDVHGRKGNHLITVATEHRAVLDVCEALEKSGRARVTVLPVDGKGRLDVDRLVSALTDESVLVSVMHANNEIGVLQPIAEIARLCKEKGVLFHTDATQSFGKEIIDVEATGIDLLSLSAHKLHGPKGVGALFVRRKGPRVRLAPLLHGGGHEKGARSGTLNVPGIVGLGMAAEIALRHRDADGKRIGALRDRLEETILARIDGVQRNGSSTDRLAGTTSLSFSSVDAEDLLAALPLLCASSAAACTSAKRQPSYVLAALGLDAERVQGSVRFSLGRFTTEEEIDFAAGEVERAVGELRRAGKKGGGVCR
jgi:cysteine desulfurase